MMTRRPWCSNTSSSSSGSSSKRIPYERPAQPPCWTNSRSPPISVSIPSLSIKSRAFVAACSVTSTASSVAPSAVPVLIAEHGLRSLLTLTPGRNQEQLLGSLADALGVGLKSLGLGERRDRIRKLVEAVGVESLDGRRPQEGVDRQSAEPFRTAVCRQDVIRARRVVAGGDGGVWPEEDAAGRVDPIEQGLVVIGLNREVFSG